MTKQIQALDHGYVQLIETWGSDERIIESARMSTNKGFQGWGPIQCACVFNTILPGSPTLKEAADPSCKVCKGTGLAPGDEKLLKYLYQHWHDSPFEFAGMVIEVQAPIFVFREWHRHRTQSYNEMSARYTPLPDFNYVPSVERCLMVSSTNKQAGAVSGAAKLTHANVLAWLDDLQDAYETAERVYQNGLALGIPKEVARLPVNVARYSRMRAQANLRNWLAFLTLRSDRNPGAQWEIRQFANPVGDLIKQIFPRTYELFAGGR
jgi:thymidylate synthase (FAD)